jgi:hypothetical protein
MSYEVPPVGRAEQPVPAARSAGAGHPASNVTRPEGDSVQLDAIPSSPPPEVLAQIDAASEAVDKLHEHGRELHFAFDPSRGRVEIEVRDLDGNVLRTIPPSKALDVAAGGELE